jgi:hypothetical protein
MNRMGDGTETQEGRFPASHIPSILFILFILFILSEY